MCHNIQDGNKLVYLLPSETMVGELSVSGLLQAVHSYSCVQTQAKLVCIMCNILMLIMHSHSCFGNTVVLLHFGLLLGCVTPLSPHAGSHFLHRRQSGSMTTSTT